jgi:hypothetical protein
MGWSSLSNWDGSQTRAANSGHSTSQQWQTGYLPSGWGGEANTRQSAWNGAATSSDTSDWTAYGQQIQTHAASGMVGWTQGQEGEGRQAQAQVYSSSWNTGSTMASYPSNTLTRVISLLPFSSTLHLTRSARSIPSVPIPHRPVQLPVPATQAVHMTPTALTCLIKTRLPTTRPRLRPPQLTGTVQPLLPAIPSSPPPPLHLLAAACPWISIQTHLASILTATITTWS